MLISIDIGKDKQFVERWQLELDMAIPWVRAKKEFLFLRAVVVSNIVVTGVM